MRKFFSKLILGILALPLLLALGFYIFWTFNTVHGEWHYKLTVSVETPEGIKTGSAVRVVKNSASDIKLLDLPDVGNPADVYGEAVVVDLGDRGQLFALINHDSDRELYAAFPIEGPSTYGGIKRYNRILKPGKKTELKIRVPKMVTFTNQNDPKSVQLVYSQVMGTYVGQIEKTVDNFEKIFGQGVKLKSITVEITDEPMTWGVVDEYLPSLRGNKPYAIANYVFKQGENK